jgi:GT2 family glycosyltransferase
LKLCNKYSFKYINTGSNIGHGAALAVAFEWLNHNSKSEFCIMLEDDSIPKQHLPLTLINSIRKYNFDFIGSDGYNVRLGKRLPILNIGIEPHEADFCLFDGSIIRSSVFSKIGYPQKEWFMMFDDYEFCYRLRKVGYKIGVIKNDFHEILHIGGGGGYTTSTLWRGYYQARNHILFLKIHFNLYNLIDFVLIQFKRTLGAVLAHDRFTRIYFRILGIIHGVLGKTGFSLDPTTLKFR